LPAASARHMCRYNAQLLPHTRTAAGVDIAADPTDAHPLRPMGV